MKFKLITALFIAVCAAGCDECSKNPLSPSINSRSRASLWLAPNLGSSDLRDMFREGHENDWVVARSKISVFQFHDGNVSGGSCSPHCGFNNENNLYNLLNSRPGGPFSWLNQQGLEIALGSGAVKPWHCQAGQMPDDTIANALNAVRNIESNGGRVSYLSVDEPFTGLAWPPCNRTGGTAIREAALKTKYFIDGIHRAAPHIQVGITEAYPHLSSDDIILGLSALEENGVNIPFLHLDVDINAINDGNVDFKTGIRQIKDFANSHGIVFGTMIGSGYGLSNETFFDDAMRTATTVREAVGTPGQLILISWSDYPPTRTSPEDDGNNWRRYPDNLPETKELTFTWMLLKISEYFGM